MTHGFRVGDPVVPFGDNSHGRHLYTYAALTQLFGSICTTTGTPVSVGERPAPAALRDYLRLANNPLRTGAVAVEFGLPASDRVEVGIFDVSGRRVRMLAERRFPAGEHRLAWDGRDDAGRAVARGVYFTRLRYAGRGFETTSKLVVLR
jgi:flagellar hook assembly protein FlgD